MEAILREGAALEQVAALRKAGNDLYASGDYATARQKYSEALALPVSREKAEFHVLYANRAACSLKLSDPEAVIADCNLALELQPTYVKALIRRSEAYTALSKHDAALRDVEAAAAAAVEQQSPFAPALQKQVATMKKEAEARFEKEKEEMMGKLKDLGNTLLGKIGLSLDNFKLQKDPTSGSYSVQFQQTPPPASQ